MGVHPNEAIFPEKQKKTKRWRNKLIKDVNEFVSESRRSGHKKWREQKISLNYSFHLFFLLQTSSLHLKVSELKNCTCAFICFFEKAIE